MKRAFLTVDLGYGDGGKGTIVDYLVRQHEAHTVVRFNGGAQAGHRVVTADGREHVFSQFGSGTLAGADTFLSRFVLVDPLALECEADHLQELGVDEPFAHLGIDGAAPIVTPFQRAVNRLRELARGEDRHGSCGMGIGETMIDLLAHAHKTLFARDLADPDRLHQKLLFLRRCNLEKLAHFSSQLPDSAEVAAQRSLLDDEDTIDWLMHRYRSLIHLLPPCSYAGLQTILDRPGQVVFEAAQGVLLDEWAGFHPYTTWSTTTLANAEHLLRESRYTGAVQRIGITRAYATRHGPGPFVSECPSLTKALPDPCNGFDSWQRGFRVGWLDLVSLRYALSATGDVDQLAVTCLDRLANLSEKKICTGYQIGSQSVNRLQPSPRARDLDYQEQMTRRLLCASPIFEAVETRSALLDRLEDALETPIGITSWGETAAEKVEVHSSTAQPSIAP